MDEVYALLREDAIELESRFRKASIEGKGTSQEVADFRENALQDFVRRYFPFPHRVTKGKIRDSFGSVSDSIDCVICNPNHPYTVDSREKFSLLLAEGIDAAIEVKPDIQSSAELVRGLVQGLSVKHLLRANTPTIMRIPWVVERSKRVPFAVFAMRCKSDPIDTGREIVEFYRTRQTPPILQADFVAVNNVGIFFNCLDSSMFRWNTPLPEEERTGWIFEEWRSNSLAGFVLHLQDLAHASIKMDEDVLPRYLTPNGVTTGVHSIRKITV